MADEKRHILMEDSSRQVDGKDVPCKVATCSCGQGEGMWHFFHESGKMKLQCVMCATTFDFPS